MVVNALLGLASCVALFLPAAKGLADLLASNAPLVGAVWALLNIVLRAVTKEKISLTD